MIKLREWHFPSPYGRSTMGHKEHLEKLTLDLSQADHARRYHAKDAILSIAGQHRLRRGRRTRSSSQFGDWDGAAEPRRSS